MSSNYYYNNLDYSIIEIPIIKTIYNIQTSYNKNIITASINPYNFNDTNYSENPNNDKNEKNSKSLNINNLFHI